MLEPLELALEEGEPALCDPDMLPELEDELEDGLDDVSGVLLLCATAHRPEHIRATAVRINFRILLAPWIFEVGAPTRSGGVECST